jgi:hypothetical protein
MPRTSTFRFAPLAGALVVLALLAPSVRADLIQNGGFEPPPVVGSVLIVNAPANGTIIPNWNVTGVNVLVLNTAYAEAGPGITFNAYAPTQSLDLTGVSNSGANAISQTISTTFGHTYVLQFALGNAASATDIHYQGTASVDVAISGGGTQTFTNSTRTNGSVTWQVNPYSFTAGPGTTTTITFTNSTVAGTWFAGLDAISVIETAAVPEPGTLTLAAAGLPLFLGLSWLRRRLSR